MITATITPELITELVEATVHNGFSRNTKIVLTSDGWEVSSTETASPRPVAMTGEDVEIHAQQLAELDEIEPSDVDPAEIAEALQAEPGAYDEWMVLPAEGTTTADPDAVVVVDFDDAGAFAWYSTVPEHQLTSHNDTDYGVWATDDGHLVEHGSQPGDSSLWYTITSRELCERAVNGAAGTVLDSEYAPIELRAGAHLRELLPILRTPVAGRNQRERDVDTARALGIVSDVIRAELLPEIRDIRALAAVRIRGTQNDVAREIGISQGTLAALIARVTTDTDPEERD